MITKCKKCGSNNLYLEPRIAGQDILTADMVALKCKDCGSWLKWCPKNERVNYLKIQDETGQNGTNQDEIGQDIKWQKLKEWLNDRMKHYNDYLNENVLISLGRQEVLSARYNQCFETIAQMEYIEKELEKENE